VAVTLSALNRSGREPFVAALGAVFESSPWVAAAVYDERPFASVDDLHRAMTAAVQRSSHEARLALIRAHPDLGTRLRLGGASATEQAGAGLDRLSPEAYARFGDLNRRYRERFGFPFVIAVRHHTQASMLEAFERRLQHGAPAEVEQALAEIAAIARFRLQEAVVDGAPGAETVSETPAPSQTAGAPAAASAAADAAADVLPGRAHDLHYGKASVTLYRTYARPLRDVSVVPESAFGGRENILFAVDVDVDVFGDNFLPAYVSGDNRDVVATDTMKNFVLRIALEYGGATLEGFLAFLGRRFLETYAQMHTLRLTGREVPFAAAPVPGTSASGAAFVPSAVLFSRGRGDHAVAEIDVRRDGAGPAIAAHRCGQIGLQLIKVTGSAFRQFARDDYTTLPEQVDRPLFVYLDVYWRYGDVADALADGGGRSRYVAAEQVRDVCQVTFHDFVSQSIQHLVHEMGQRLLRRFPQLSEVSFEAQNRLWDTAAVSERDSRIKVYCDPRPPYGRIGLTLRRE
jgi:urate oxidase/2-oxo-4-hydroxy-4-carboxy-5-ureidoimidazoline decarboxylase